MVRVPGTKRKDVTDAERETVQTAKEMREAENHLCVGGLRAP